MIPLPDRHNPIRANGEANINDRLAPYLPHRPADLPPDLTLVASAWPSLPKPIRAGIVAMVEAACSPVRRPSGASE
jgi:hypothetical protein